MNRKKFRSQPRNFKRNFPRNAQPSSELLRAIRSVQIVQKDEKVFILAPTRELAVQIYEELRSFTQGLHVSAVLCIGGTNMQRQKNELRQNPQFVIGTPGRIKDLIQENSLSLRQFANVVLDEADRMVDIGFINDIKYFISLLPQKRQSLFF